MKQLAKSKRQEAGQAMAEMLLALVAMVVIIVGIVTLGDAGYQHVDSMLKMSSGASQDALDPNSPGTPANFDFYNTCNKILSQPVGYPSYWNSPIEQQHNLDYEISPSNQNSFWTLEFSQSSKFSPRVDFGNALQQFVIQGDITIRSGTFCWPKLTGLN